MEFIERVSVERLQFLLTLDFSDFIEKCLNKLKKYSIDDCRTKYLMLKRYCTNMIKSNGVSTQVYNYSNDVEGRLFSGGSLQGVSSIVRGFLMKDIGSDIDMCNAHPVILSYLCKKHGIECSYLDYYVNNRDTCLDEFSNRDIGKSEYLSSINKDSLSRIKTKAPIFKKYDAQIKKIQKSLVSIAEYEFLVNSVPNDKTYNKTGSAVNRILCYYENIILNHVINYLTKKNIEIAILMFDGLMIYGDYYLNSELLNDIAVCVNSKMPGLNSIWKYKEHNMALFDYSNSKKLTKSFESIVNEFEKTHLKIVNKSLFIKHENNSIVFLTLSQLKISYAHLSYDEPLYNSKNICVGVKSQPFINKWIGHTHNIRRKDDVGIYPNIAECPDNIFNLWTPFAMELYTEPYEYKQKELDVILNHILILCGNDIVVFDYFIKWIAQMIQFPHIKTIMPTFISKEGAGKGTMFKLFEKMLGQEKVFETTDPSRDVWGDFNGMMASCFLVNLNELSKKDTIEADGKIKGLITDNTLSINQKGLPQYKIKSYHRFITTTNNEDPIKTTHGDRRNLIIRSSDEKKGDFAYFSKLHSYFEDINVIRTCYDYFKCVKGVDKFGEIPIPKTEHQLNMKELSTSPVEQWLKSFTAENIENDKASIELYGSEIYELFTSWCSKNGVKYEINCLKLGVVLTNMKITGIYKGKKTNAGRMKLFNIVELKQTLQIGYT